MPAYKMVVICVFTASYRVSKYCSNPY